MSWKQNSHSTRLRDSDLLKHKGDNSSRTNFNKINTENQYSISQRQNNIGNERQETWLVSCPESPGGWWTENVTNAPAILAVKKFN